LFIEICGDKHIDKYKRDDIAAFAATLQKKPSKRGEGGKFNVGVAELTSMAENDKSIKTCGVRAVEKHMGETTSFLKWCVDQQMINTNVASGVFKAKQTVRRNKERQAWSSDQQHCLFTSPIYHCNKSVRLRNLPGDVVVRNAKYWLPLLAAFHPARLEKMAQLRVEDVKQREGVDYFDIRGFQEGDDDKGGPPRKVKSRASQRRVPLHNLVIELGFLKHVRGQKGDPSGRGFPELEPGGVES
jgi:hypothetical protein